MTASLGCDGSGSDPKPATGAVSVLVLVGGEPAPGVDVVFHAKEDGAVVEHLVTGSAGTATSVIDRGDSVTVAWSGDREMVTFTDLAPLDDLTVSFSLGFDSPVNTTVDLIVPPFPDSSDFVVDHPCGLRFSGFPGGQIELRDECFSPPGSIAIAIDATTPDGDPLGWTARTNVSVPTGGAATIEMPAWRTDFEEVTIEVNGSATEAMAGGLLFSGTVIDRSVTAGSVFREVGFPASITLPRLPPGRSQSLLTMLLSADAWYIDLDPDFPNSISLDVARDLPGPIEVAVQGLGSAPRPFVSWTGPTVPGHDATILRLRWKTSADYFTWDVYTRPRAAFDLEIPALPDALAAFRPENAVEATLSVNQIESSLIFGYSDFRRRAHLGYLDWPPSGHLQERLWWGTVEWP